MRMHSYLVNTHYSKFSFPVNRFILFDPVNFISLKIASVGLKMMIKRLWSAGSRVPKRISVSAARTGDTDLCGFTWPQRGSVEQRNCPLCGSNWCYIGFAFYAKTAVVYRSFWFSFRPIPQNINLMTGRRKSWWPTDVETASLAL